MARVSSSIILLALVAFLVYLGGVADAAPQQDQGRGDYAIYPNGSPYPDGGNWHKIDDGGLIGTDYPPTYNGRGHQIDQGGLFPSQGNY